MRSNKNNLIKIDAYKENWYALAACMCSPKVRSRSHAFSLMGMKIKHEPGVSISKNIEFDKKEVEALYKEFKSVRQVAIKLGCNPSSMANFFKKENIETLEVKPMLSDKYDKNKIWELRNKGKTVKEIAIAMGYTYPSLYKYIKANIG